MMNPLSPEMEQAFYKLLQRFPADSPAETAYAARAATRGWLTLQHLPSGSESMKILDVGSMKGLFGPAYLDLWKYGEAHLLGYDFPASGVLHRTGPDGRSYGFPTQRANIELEPWPYPDETFDTIVCMEVLEHLIFDPVFAMNELCRVLKKSGQALITVPNAASDDCLTYLANDRQPGFLRHYIKDALIAGQRDLRTVYNLGHFHEYTRADFECLANSTGFEITQLSGMSDAPMLLDSFRFRLLRHFTRWLFPHSRRIREQHLLALLKKKTFTPLAQLKNRYPPPLYQPLFQ